MKLSNKIIIIALAVILGGILYVGASARIMIGKAVKQGDIAFEKADLGERVKKAYDIDGFRELSASGIWDIKVSKGDGYQVILEAEERLIEDTIIDKRGRQIYLSMEEDMYVVGRQPIRVEIITPELSSVSLRGGANLTLEDFTSDSFTIESEGASNVEGRNNIFKDLMLSCEGAVNIDLKDSKTVNAEVDLEGASNVVLTMDGGSLTGEIEGVGSLEYYGDVSEEDVHNKGLSNIQRH